MNLLDSAHYGDCLEVLKMFPDKYFDMILCDMPYGTTSCTWDSVIDLAKLWQQYKRIIKDNSAIVLTASQPFTSILVTSNLEMFRHSWIYKKRCASNFAQAKIAPMKEHEDVLVFSKGRAAYYPIKEERKGSGLQRSKYAYSDKSRHAVGEFVSNMHGNYDSENDSGNDSLRYPSSVQEFNNRAVGDRGLHPTQKPVALFEYLVNTYTLPGAVVLDSCAGSGTTGVACKNLNRNYVLVEKDKKYFDVLTKRLAG